MPTIPVTTGGFRLFPSRLECPPVDDTTSDLTMPAPLHQILRWVLPIHGLISAGLCPGATPEARPPNIVFILCDDLGYGDLGAYFQNHGDGGRKPKVEMAATPHLDALAPAGMQLRHHYTGAPVCAPARASLLLGVHQGHANVRDNQFDKALEDQHTLASVLKHAGYRSVCIGKWGLQGGKEMPAHPLNRGFDEYFGYIGHGAGHLHYPKENGKPLYDGWKEVSAQYDKCYTTDLFTARAKKFIIDHQAQVPGKPFFLYLAYDTPHARTQAPPRAFPDGYGVNGGLQWLGTPGKMINTATGQPDSWIHPEHATATWNDPQRGARSPWPDTAKRYATMVRRIDDCVHDLVATLRDLGLEQNTLVVFTSDNGPSKESYLKGRDSTGYSRANDPGFFRGYGPFDGIKRDCYEGGVRVGAIAWWPGTIPAGTSSQLASQFHDWMPTFCEMAGIPAPARTDGASLLPELTARGKRPASTIYVEYSNNTATPDYEDFMPARRGKPRRQMQMIRIGGLVGVRHDIRSHNDDFEIYEIAKDPSQRRNLAPSMRDLQQRMKDRVLQIRRPDPAAPRTYLDALPVPASPPGGSTAPGLLARMIAVDVPWPVAPAAVAGIAPAAAVTPGQMDKPVDSRHAAVLEGWIEIPQPGSYRFSLPEGSRAILKLHGATVLDTDRGSGGGGILLEAGRHPLMLSILLDDDSPPPVLSWSEDAGTPEPIPAKHFTHKAP
jgi:arylsulfatase A-like enzyme